MILTCPECTMRYLVSEGAIGPHGRRVRCAHCGHLWRQQPEEGLDEALFGHDGPAMDMDDHAFLSDNDAPFETSRHQADIDDAADDDFHSILQKEIEGAPIPEGVKPDHRADDVLPTAQAGGRTKASPEKWGGYAAAVIIWFAIMGALLLMQPQISRAWPPSNLFYSFFNLKPVAPGDGLSLSGLHAELADGRIRLLGEIINLRETELKVPSVMASIVDVDGKEIDRILIAPPVAHLKAEGRVAFDAVYPRIPDGASNVNYAFSFVSVKAQKAEAEPEAQETLLEKGVPLTELTNDEADPSQSSQH